MKPDDSRRVPARAGAIAALLLALGGCLGPPDLDADPLVVTEAGAPLRPAVPPERAAAVAEMRAKARAGEEAAYPDAFRSDRLRRLATREEPRPVAEVEAIQRELAALAREQQSASTPEELALLEARAAELRRLAAQSLRGAMRP